MSSYADSDMLMDALRHFAERLLWFTSGRSSKEGMETDKVRLLLSEWDSTVAPVQAQVTDPQLRPQLDGLLPLIEAARARVRFMFLVALHKLMEQRFGWLQWERAMQAPVLMKQRLEEASPEQRQIMLDYVRQMFGREFDAAALYHEAMDRADEREAEWNKSLAQFQTDWNDELTPETLTRLTTGDAPAAALWMAELLAEMQALASKYPALAR